MKSEADLAAYVEQRSQDISAAAASFRERGLVARADILAEGAEPGSAEDVGSILFEHQAVMADEGITRYENPTEAELMKVLALAEVYDGNWYHSYVSMVSNDGWTPLQQRVVNLPNSAGVFRLYSYAGLNNLELP